MQKCQKNVLTPPNDPIFLFYWNRNRKGEEKKKKEKKASLEFLDFLDRVSVERRAAKQGGHGPCRAQPRGVGAQRHPRCVPAAAASTRGSPGTRGGTVGAGLCDGRGGAFVFTTQPKSPAKGLPQAPAHSVRRGERGAVCRNAAFPRKKRSLRSWLPRPGWLKPWDEVNSEKPWG